MTGGGGGEISNTISGGTFNGPVYQGRDFIVIHPAPAPVALAQLPPLAVGFTGREAELAEVAALLDPAANATAKAVVVSAVAGLAGVGKTALAVQAAHAAVSSGWFPGGALFIDLHGYDPSPVQPRQSLDALLRALGIRGEHIPEGTEQRAALYRSALAKVTGPVLIIADNASTEAQVRPLIPGPGPHRVIITSRHTLAGLRARLLDVAVLDQAAAVALLDAAVRAARPGDDRIGGEPAVAGRLAEVCGGLPLALQIIAALLVADPELSAADLAEQMVDEVRRLQALRYDDGSGVSAPSVAAAFELSYRQLDQDAALLFRLLPADPGPDVSAEAAAQLAGWPVDRVRAVIGQLTQAHLVEPAGRPGRWRMHDLLRLYARQLPEVGPGERDQAFGRVLAWYLRHAAAAEERLQARGDEVPVTAVFAGRADALAWLDDQRPNLVAAVALAADTGRYQEAMALPLRLGEYLAWRRRFDDWLAVLEVSRATARQVNDEHNEGLALMDLGHALCEARRFEEAISACRDAVAIFGKTGYRLGEGMRLTNLGNALRAARRFEEAISVHQDAVAICRETGDRDGEGMALSNLGIALKEARRFEEAISACRDAVAIYRETGDRHGEGRALINLGGALRGARRFEEAISADQDAVAICRETGDRYGEGMVLSNLGYVLREARRFEEAISACRDAAAIYRENGDRHGEGMALNNLGGTLSLVRRFEEAISACRDAVAIFRETGDRHAEGEAVTNLGATLLQLGRFEEAITAFRDAAAICRETDDRHGEGRALTNLGGALRPARRFEEAISACQDAVAIFRETGDRHSEGMALNNLGLALGEVHRFEEAIDCYRQDIAICRETGDLYRAGQTLSNLGNIYQKMRQPDDTITCWQEAAAAMRDAGEHKEAARLEQLSAQARTRRRWWRTNRLAEV